MIPRARVRASVPPTRVGTDPLSPLGRKDGPMPPCPYLSDTIFIVLTFLSPTWRLQK